MALGECLSRETNCFWHLIPSWSEGDICGLDSKCYWSCLATTSQEKEKRRVLTAVGHVANLPGPFLTAGWCREPSLPTDSLSFAYDWLWARARVAGLRLLLIYIESLQLSGREELRVNLKVSEQLFLNPDRAPGYDTGIHKSPSEGVGIARETSLSRRSLIWKMKRVLAQKRGANAPVLTQENKHCACTGLEKAS